MSFQINNARTTFFASREEYLQYRSLWKSLAASKQLTAQDCLIHTLLTGKDLYRAFSPSKKAVRGGAAPYVTLANLLYSAVLRAPRLKTEADTPYLKALYAHLAERKAAVSSRLSDVGAGVAENLLEFAREEA